MTGKGNHAHALRPFGIAYPWVVLDIIRQVWLLLGGNESDFERTEGNPAVGTVKMSVQSRACLEF